MRTRLFIILAITLTLCCNNVAVSENIAHGVEVVVIDAGHGGKFPGAHYNGIYEKDLTLKVALKLGKLIEEQLSGVQVVYTRKSDKALGVDLATDLQARADIANKAGGDIFISIHVNAARATAARGVETLIMGESSKEQRYNESALFDNNREDLIDMSDERTAAIVRAYIQNLQFTYGQYSMAMARCIQNNYLQAGRHSRGIKPQLLRVLYATDMPGVLTEIGFMSNPQEMAYMKSEKGQNEIAQSLFNAVREYSKYLSKTRMEEQGEATTQPAPADTTTQSAPAPEKEPVKTTPTPPTPQPAAENTLPEDPIRYTVQITASPKAIALNSAQFKTYRNQVREYQSEGTFRYKYGVGEYASRDAAQIRLREVRRHFPDAFVVRCQGSKIVK